jgi:redox-sensing transcriptional repressor
MRISKEIIFRLSNYRRVLYKLEALGFVKVFSDNLGDSIGVSASQVRKDFNLFQIKGQKKGGYNISELLSKMNKVLKKEKEQRVILVGCGRMGATLMNYNNFIEEGIRVIAGFDSDPTKVDEKSAIPILATTKLESFIKENKIKVAILTTPEYAASAMFNKLLSFGIKGVLNCTPMHLQTTEHCEVRNINIGLELENIFYFVFD